MRNRVSGLALHGLACRPSDHGSSRAYGGVRKPWQIESASIWKRAFARAGPLQVLVLCEKAMIRVRTLANIVMRSNVCRRCRAYRFKLRPIRVERRDRIRKRDRIPDRRHEPGDAVCENLSDPAFDTADDRHKTDAHRFEKGDGHTFPSSRQH